MPLLFGLSNAVHTRSDRWPQFSRLLSLLRADLYTCEFYRYHFVFKLVFFYYYYESVVLLLVTQENVFDLDSVGMVVSFMC